jgi:hypothetical protein
VTTDSPGRGFGVKRNREAKMKKQLDKTPPPTPCPRLPGVQWRFHNPSVGIWAPVDPLATERGFTVPVHLAVIAYTSTACP